MSDDIWRRRERDADDTSEFGGPLFPDDPAEDRPARRGENTAERRLSFGPNDTGPLPHWTDPPTGEIPRLAPVAQGPTGDPGDDDDDVDVWSSFTTETPIWRDDEEDADPTADPSGRVGADLSASGGFPRDPALPDEGDDMTGEVPRDGISEPMGRPRTAEVPMAPPPRREPGRITIGTDPAGVPRRDPTGGTRRRSGQQRSGRPAGPPRTTAATAGARRDLPMAIGVAAVLAVAFILLTRWEPVGVLALVTVVLAIAGFEYFGKITEKGYRPAVAPGLAAVVAAPLAAYWVGETAIPLIVAFAFIAGAVGFLGANGVESGPLPNMAVTTLGVIWIGVLGSYAALIVAWSNLGGGNPLGTDTLFLIVLGVAANDIGALAVGSTLGRTPLRAWISPGKTLEGVLGGAVLTILALFIYTRVVDMTTWTETRDVLILGLVIAVMAPLGDLTESMFKRNIDVKDFGTVVAGHGGVLDRFDSFLFVLPSAYYATQVLFS